MAATSLLAGAVLTGQAPAQSVSLVAGVCVFDTLNVDFIPDLPSVLSTTVVSTADVKLDGQGTCLLADATTIYDATIGGTLTPLLSTPSYTCAGGVAIGNVTLTMIQYTSKPNFMGKGYWVAGAVAATLVVVDELTTPPEFAGAGAFTQVFDALDAVDCVTSGLASTTYTGVFVFEDPVV